VRGNQRVTSDNPEASTKRCAKYGRDLTEEARKGKLDPVIGRDEEIRRVMQILSRRTKNNPVLIGEPGVGKTASSRAGAAHRQRRRAAGSLRDKRWCRSIWARWSPAPNIAASSRSGSRPC
jgi:ATP-dependent Clp protease ATP-binding subunit ClpB